MQPRWTARAREDLYRVPNLYDDDELARRAVARILAAVDLAVKRPGIGSIVHGLRKRRVGGSPFYIFLKEAPGRIDVVRVLHVRSDWQAQF